MDDRKRDLLSYSLAGLLYVATEGSDVEFKSAALAEFRARKRAADAQRQARELTRESKEDLAVELEIKGLESKEKYTRKRAQRNLFAVVRDRAFEITPVPEGLEPVAALKQYNRDVHQNAKKLYEEYRKKVGDAGIQRSRDAIRKARCDFYANRDADRKARAAQHNAYLNARFPLRGLKVACTDTIHPERVVGTILGYGYRKTTSLFTLRIKCEDGEILQRAFAGIEPLEQIELFNEIKASFLYFERQERNLRLYGDLKRRIAKLTEKATEVKKQIDAYEGSEAQREFRAREEMAKEIAVNARLKHERKLF